MKTRHWLLLAVFVLCLEACAAGATPTSVPPAPPVLPTPALLGDYPRLSPEDMRSDLDEFFRRLETTHPQPYTNRPKSEVDAQRQQLTAELAQPLSMIEFYRLVAPLVNSLGDSHTYVSLPGDTLASIAEQERFFPLGLALEQGHAYVLEDVSLESSVQPGSELLEINGLLLPRLLAEVGRYTRLGDSLREPALWLVLGSQERYNLRLLPPGESSPVRQELSGVPIQRILEARAATPPARPLAYRQLPGVPVGLLTLWGFEGTGALAKPAFVQMEKNGVHTLIIDIRENGGGLYDQVQALMDYLTDQPYRLCARSFQSPFGGYGSGEPRQSECEWITPFPVEQRFNGKLYLLVGQDTFSAGVTFATILQDFGLATLVGEPTRETASYCGNVASELTSLPRTGLLYLLPSTCYVRPSGVLDGQGVVPEITITTSLAAKLAGQDPVLDAVQALVLESTSTP